MINNINIKVYFAALKVKYKKLFNSKYDPYLPLTKGVFLSPSSYTFEMYKKSKLALAFSKSKLTPRQWQIKARKKLVELSGYESIRPKPITVKDFPEKELLNNVFKKKVYIRVSPTLDLPINLLFKKPLRNNMPVFIFLSGSTSGVHVGWGEAKVPIDHERIQVGADIALQAAEKGYLVVTYEQAGYGERLERHLDKKSKQRTIDFANHLLLLGKTLMGKGATEISSVIDWLALRSNKLNINKNKIYLYGHSSGGTLVQFAAALDIRVKGVLASGSVGPIRETIGARGAGGGDSIIPGLLNWLDTEDIIALIAPRPFVGLSGDKDHIFPFSGVKKVITLAKAFFIKLRAEKKINYFKVKGRHQYYNKESWKAWYKFIDSK